MKGNNTHRHEQNPEEKLFHDAFVKHMSYNQYDISRVVFGSDGRGFPREVINEREEAIVISAIQWLGSPVGQGFLNKLGYIKSDNP